MIVLDTTAMDEYVFIAAGALLVFSLVMAAAAVWGVLVRRYRLRKHLGQRRDAKPIYTTEQFTDVPHNPQLDDTQEHKTVEPRWTYMERIGFEDETIHDIKP